MKKFKITLRKQFFQINKNIFLVFMQQNSFVVPTKHFAISIKFWLLKQNVLLEQQKKSFLSVCIKQPQDKLFLSVFEEDIVKNVQITNFS